MDAWLKVWNYDQHIMKESVFKNKMCHNIYIRKYFEAIQQHAQIKKAKKEKNNKAYMQFY